MHPLEQLEFSTRVVKRAQYEAFSISLDGETVRIRNESHANPADHEYHVTVDDGVPVDCTCPADEQFDGACKHRVAVAIRRPVLDAVATRQTSPSTLVPDGGVTEETTQAALEDAVDEAATDDEECDECLEDFPCWPCVRAGDEPMPD